MAHLVEKITIDQSIDAVFQFLKDPKNRTKMYVNVAEVIKEKDEQADVQVGDRYKEIRQLTNRRIATMLEVSELVDNQRVTITSDSNGYKVIYQYDLIEKDGKTLVEFAETIKPETLRMKLMKSMLVNMQIKEDKDHLLNLKKYFESEK